MTDPNTISKMAEALTDCGMREAEALERSIAIAHALSFDALDRLQVAAMLRPDPGVCNGIADRDMRELAGMKALAVFIFGTFDSDMAKWAGLIMWCGMSEVEASAYMNRQERKAA